MRISGVISYAMSNATFFGGGQPEPETIYYPGTTSPAEAERLRMTAGEERAGVDFVLGADPPVLMPVAAMRIAQAGGRPRSPEATATIRGRVSAVDGRALAHARVESDPRDRSAAIGGDDRRCGRRGRVSRSPSGALSRDRVEVGLRAARSSRRRRRRSGIGARGGTGRRRNARARRSHAEALGRRLRHDRERIWRAGSPRRRPAPSDPVLAGADGSAADRA